MNPKKPGNVFIVSAASGTGKTTLVSRLLASNGNLRVSVSHTTRQPRISENDGEHYYFVDVVDFEKLIAQGEFLEHAQVFGNYYGTSLQEVKRLQQQGFDVILEIDVQGAQQVRRILPDAVSIFILPPSLSVLSERLHRRNTDSEEVIQSRLKQARSEIEQALLFDYIVINDSLAAAEAELSAIVRAQRLTQAWRQDFIENLLS